MPVISEHWKMRPKHNWYSKLIRKYYKLRVGLTKPRNPIPDSHIFEKAEKERRLVIQVPFGGLGDHLAYSSLPELLWNQKGINAFISNKSVYRSKAIRDFVWGLNPYVTFTNEKGWFIYKPSEHACSTIDEYLQKLFKLKGDGCPKVYYKPNLIEQLREKTIVDPSCGAAGKANGYFEPDFYRRLIEYLRSNIRDFVLITHQHTGTKNQIEKLIKTELNPDCYNVTTIEGLADALFSANNRYLLHSGAASLTVSLNLQSNILNYIKPSTYNSFKYRINNYIDLM